MWPENAVSVRSLSLPRTRAWPTSTSENDIPLCRMLLASGPACPLSQPLLLRQLLKSEDAAGRLISLFPNNPCKYVSISQKLLLKKNLITTCFQVCFILALFLRNPRNCWLVCWSLCPGAQKLCHTPLDVGTQFWIFWWLPKSAFSNFRNTIQEVTIGITTKGLY